MERIDPKVFGITEKTVMYKSGPDAYIIEIMRKSRIIMKDARMVLKKADAVRNAVGGAQVSLRTNAPVCSKSNAFLKAHGIDVLPPG